jgi:hypothetical protein
MALPRQLSHASLVSLIALSVLAGAPTPAFADLYKWIDASGRTHYSDTPPDDGSKLETTATLPRAPMPPAAGSDKSAVQGSEAKGATRPGEPKATTPANAPATESKEDPAAAEKRRADNCDRLRAEAGVLGSGNRVFTVDAKGERSYIGDEARTTRQAELAQLIANDCPQ